MKYEAGKKYKRPGNLLLTCLYVDDEVVIMRYDGNRYVMSDTPEHFEKGGYIEYKEPVVEKVTRHVWKGSDGYFTSPQNVNFSAVTIGTIELTIIDGKLTDVKIV